MAVLSREHNLLYIQVPATGSTVVSKALEAELGAESVPAHPIRRNGYMIVSRSHCTVSELLEHDLLSRDTVDSCLVFANVRNPFDRWVTYYQRRAGEEWIEYSYEIRRQRVDDERKARGLSDEEYERRRSILDRREQEQKRKGQLMRKIGFNAWMKVTLLRWWGNGVWRNGGGIREYAFPMLEGVDVAIRQERLNEGLNRVLEMANVDRHIDLPRENTTGGKKQYSEYYSWSTRRLAERMLSGEMEEFGYQFQGLVNDNTVIDLREEVQL